MNENSGEVRPIGTVMSHEEALWSSTRYGLEEYLEKIETFLAEEKNKLKNHNLEWQDRIKQLPLKEQEFAKQYWLEKFNRYSIEFPRILRNSFLVTAISLLEFELAIIGKKLKEQQAIPISWRELKGDTLEQAKRFCKIAGLNISSDNENWQNIQDVYLVRNCIVHNNGTIKGSRDERKLNRFAQQEGIISKGDDKEIDLTKKFCIEVIALTEDFTSDVWDMVYELRPRIVRSAKEGLRPSLP